MDIKEFYPSITAEILNKAIKFASNHTNITDDDMRTINHCRKSLLFFHDTAWKKKTTHTSFDVTMGSFDGAEICELVGLYLLNKLSAKFGIDNIGLYRDDGLGILRTMSGRITDKLRKEIIQIFKECGFQIEIATSLSEVNFLNVTFNLKTESYRPYKKPNDNLMYINTSSNHPQQILKQLPISINHRLSKNSSNETIFNESKTEYIAALKSSGYKDPTLVFNKPQMSKRKNRCRKVILFNPPFNKNISSNVAQTFLRLIDKHFSRNKKLHKLFNRNNVKVSYSCTPNIGRIIKSHNKSLTNAKRTKKPCNCRDKENCPVQGDCRKESVVYKCDVTAPGIPKKTYIGLTSQEFKTRLGEHKTSFNNEQYEYSTTLSTYIWQLKRKGITTPTLSLSIVKEMTSYNNILKSCKLCLYEKYSILNYPVQKELLNKRSELIQKCCHQISFLLANYKSKD